MEIARQFITHVSGSNYLYSIAIVKLLIHYSVIVSTSYWEA